MAFFNVPRAITSMAPMQVISFREEWKYKACKKRNIMTNVPFIIFTIKVIEDIVINAKIHCIKC